jgi:hypothetical protein
MGEVNLWQWESGKTAPIGENNEIGIDPSYRVKK